MCKNSGVETRGVETRGWRAWPAVLWEGAASPTPHQLGFGGCCKLHQWALWQSPDRNQIWCILALKSDIWWQQF